MGIALGRWIGSGEAPTALCHLDRYRVGARLPPIAAVCEAPDIRIVSNFDDTDTNCHPSQPARCLRRTRRQRCRAPSVRRHRRYEFQFFGQICNKQNNFRHNGTEGGRRADNYDEHED